MLDEDLEGAIADAATYKHAIVSAHVPAAAMAPAWFIPAVREAVRREISELKELKVMMSKVLSLQLHICLQLNCYSKNMNRQYGNGSVQQFEIVPFLVVEDGQTRLQDPTEEPVSAPLIIYDIHSDGIYAA